MTHRNHNRHIAKSHSRLDFVSTDVLPEVLRNLQSRQESTNDLVQYFEDKYLIAKSRSEPLIEIKKEGLEALVELLSVVAGDVEHFAMNLDQMITMESNNVETMRDRINVASARMRMSEEHYCRKKLKKVRISRTTRMVSNQACMTLKGLEDLIVHSIARPPLEARIEERIDDVYAFFKKKSIQSTRSEDGGSRNHVSGRSNAKETETN